MYTKTDITALCILKLILTRIFVVIKILHWDVEIEYIFL